MLKIEQAVLVEGKYDKIRLSAVLDALILDIGGFGIFRDKEKQKFLKRLAQEKGIVILTDSDAAGFRIRSFLGGMLPQDRVWHAYIPDVFGKEKRKAHSSAEGKLGVEGMSAEVLQKAILQAGLPILQTEKERSEPITTMDLYRLGLSGTENSAERRRQVLRYFELPARLSSSSFRRLASDFIGKEALEKAVGELFDEKK